MQKEASEKEKERKIEKEKRGQEEKQNDEGEKKKIKTFQEKEKQRNLRNNEKCQNNKICCHINDIKFQCLIIVLYFLYKGNEEYLPVLQWPKRIRRIRKPKVSVKQYSA